MFDPLKGAKKDGLRGFAKGAMTGLAGAIAKPTAGVLDLATQVWRLLLNATTCLVVFLNLIFFPHTDSEGRWQHKQLLDQEIFDQ